MNKNITNNKNKQEELDDKLKDILQNTITKYQHSEKFGTEREQNHIISIAILQIKQTIQYYNNKEKYTPRFVDADGNIEIHTPDPSKSSLSDNLKEFATNFEPINYERICNLNKERLSMLSKDEIKLLLDVYGLITTPKEDLPHYERMLNNRLQEIYREEDQREICKKYTHSYPRKPTIKTAQQLLEETLSKKQRIELEDDTEL